LDKGIGYRLQKTCPSSLTYSSQSERVDKDDEPAYEPAEPYGCIGM